MILFLKVDEDLITEASFQTYGCGPAIAAGSVLTCRLPGLRLSEARFSVDEVIKLLGGLPANKRHCAQLAADALEDALR